MTIQNIWPRLTIVQVLGVLSMLLVLATLSTAQAEVDKKAPTVMVILDGSGSMWGKLGTGEKTKLGVSQSLLIESLSASNPKLNLGLASFGHRRAGNCADAEVIVPPGTSNTETIIQRITKHNPRGKGPLSLALRKAAESIDTASASTVVLIHDGYDNCRQDPCEVAEEIAASHPNLAIHLISLDLPASTASAMSCLATKTNGKAYVVHNEAEFKKAMQSAMALTMLRPPTAAERLTDRATPETKAKKEEDTGPSRLRLVAGFETDTEQRIRDVSWRVVSPAAPKKALIEKRASELAAPIPPGRYIVYAKAGLAQTDQHVTVREHGETRLRMSLDAGILTFTKASQQGVGEGTADPVFLSLRSKSGGTESNDGRPLWIGSANKTSQLIVPVGSYQVEITRGTMTKTTDVAIQSGKSTALDTGLDGGFLVLDSTITASTADDGKTENTTDDTPVGLTKNVSYVISTDDPSAPGGRREVGRSASPHAKFQLPAGTFYAEAHLGEAKRERRFAIGDGQVVRHQFSFDVAQVTLEAQLGNQPISDTTPITFKVYALGAAPDSPMLTVSKQKPSLVLPTGRYRFEAVAPAKVRGQSPDILVRSGAKQAFAVPLNAGRVMLQSDTQTPHSRGTRYQIRDASGMVVWRGRAETKVSTLLAPGRYALEARANPAQKRNFDIRVGEVTVVKLDSGP